jgi:signal transduction histidine kinase
MAVKKKKAGHATGHETIDSKNLLQSVIDASLTGVSYLKPIRNDSEKVIDFECVFANNKVFEFTGCNEMIGKKYSELFSGFTEKEVFARYINALEENDVQDFEVHEKNERSDNWFRITAVRLGDGIVVSSEDITQRKRIEKELEAQHNILKQTEELAQAGSWEYDINTKEFLWSDGMYSLFNMQKGSHVIPGVYLDYVTEQDQEIAQKIVDVIERKFEPFEETLHINFNGTVKTLKAKAAPLKNESGQIEKMLGVDMDITKAQQSEEKIMELNKSLFTMNKELSSLNAELKNFNTITANNYNETLRHVYIHLEAIVTNDARSLSDSGRANLRRAQSGVQKLKLLTNDINNYLQLYNIGINKQRIDPNKIIGNVIAGIKGKIEDAQATIKTTELPSLQADPLLFSHLMTNLLDNAIKFRNHVDPIIKIHYSQDGELNERRKAADDADYIVVIVSDNGIGFQQEEMDKMFEFFHQLPIQGKHKGSGMGLAICKKIMEMHGGYIHAEGEKEKGASFQCYFPS